MKRFMIAAAALVVATQAFAQGGAGGEPTKGSDPNAPAAIKQQPGETKSAPVTATPAAPSGANPAPSNSADRKQGPETGSAKDNASAPSNQK